MNIEDCEVGMEVKPKKDIGVIGVSKGEKLVIRKIEEDTNGGCEGYLYFEAKGYVGVSAENFEPINKFKVGDKVLYRYFHGKICNKVRYCGEDSKGNPIIEHDNGYVTNNIDYSELSPLKKKDELEVGDKFKNKFYEFKIIFVAHDDFYDKKKYICKINDTGSKGLIQTMFPEDIKEIIYE